MPLEQQIRKGEARPFFVGINTCYWSANSTLNYNFGVGLGKEFAVLYRQFVFPGPIRNPDIKAFLRKHYVNTGVVRDEL